MFILSGTRCGVVDNCRRPPLHHSLAARTGVTESVSERYHVSWNGIMCRGADAINVIKRVRRQ